MSDLPLLLSLTLHDILQTQLEISPVRYWSKEPFWDRPAPSRSLALSTPQSAYHRSHQSVELNGATNPYTMGLFSRLKKSTRTDKKDKRLSTTKKRESVNAGKPKYHHTPTHAAVDALNGAPPSWRKADQQRVREINARKSQILMFGRDSSMAEFLRNMPVPPGSEGPGAAYTPTATPRWKRETARGRNSAFIPLEISISPVRSGLSSSGKLPDIRASPASPLSLTRAAQKRLQFQA